MRSSSKIISIIGIVVSCLGRGSQRGRAGSTVSNLPDCRSRGHKLDPSQIDYEIIKRPFSSLPLIQEIRCCQLQGKVCAQSIVNCLVKLAQGKI